MILPLFECLWIIFMGQVWVNIHNIDSMFWCTQEINNWSKYGRFSSIKTDLRKKKPSTKYSTEAWNLALKFTYFKILAFTLSSAHTFFFFGVSYCQSSFSLFNIKLFMAEQWQKTIFKADNSLLIETFLNPPFFIQILTTFPEDTK